MFSQIEVNKLGNSMDERKIQIKVRYSRETKKPLDESERGE